MRMGHWRDDSDKETAEYAARNVCQCRLFHHKSYEDWPGTEAVPPRSEVSD